MRKPNLRSEGEVYLDVITVGSRQRITFTFVFNLDL